MVALSTVMIWHFSVGLIVEDTSTRLLLPWNHNGLVAVIMRGRCSICNMIDLGFCPFPIIFGLNCGQAVTPMFTSQGKIVLFIILQLILHG